MEGDLGIVNAALGKGHADLVREEAVGVAGEGNDIYLTALLVINQPIWRASLIC